MSLNIINNFKLFSRFPSMYEVFNPLTNLNRQHFVEWFSGSVLDSIWVITNNAGGTGSSGMVDEVDGGFSVTSDTGAFQGTELSFGGGVGAGNALHKVFDFDASVMLFVMKWDTDSTLVNASGCGLHSEVRGDGAGNNAAIMEYDNKSSFFRLRTINNAGSQTNTATSLLTDTNFHLHKIETKASSVDLTIDGATAVTSTTNLPTIGMQPNFGGQKLTGTGTANTYQIRYVEAFNT